MLPKKGRTINDLMSSFLGKFPIGTKIIFGYIVLVFMMGAGTAAAVWTLNYSSINYDNAIQRQKDISSLKSIQIFIEKQNSDLSDLIVNHNKATIGVFRANSNMVKSLSTDLESKLVTDKEKTILGDINKLNLEIDQSFSTSVVPVFESNDWEKLKLEAGKVRNLTNNISDDIQKLSTEIESGSRLAIDTASNNKMLLSYVLSGLALLGAIIGMILGIILTKNISGRVKIVGKAAAGLAEGDLTQLINIHDRDEIGKMATSFSVMIQYLQGIANLAEGVSIGNLTLETSPKSVQDILGNAFKVMVQNLRGLIHLVRGNADNVGSAAETLSSAASETQNATSQIAMTIQQVAIGTTRQTEAATATAESMTQMTHTIQVISEGARQQADAVMQASIVTQQMSDAIQQMNGNLQIAQKESSNTAVVAQSGAQTIRNTIREMEIIREKVGLSTDKVLEMGKRSEQIEGILGTIQEIASQTNLLALNAAIEAARSSGLTVQTSQSLLHGTLLAAANTINLVLSTYNPNLSDNDLVTFAQRTGVDVLLISDEDGVITSCSDPAIKGYRFSEDPKEQSFVFRSLLKVRDGKILQPIQARSIDNKPFIWVGVSRHDKAGIIQAGMFGDVVYRSADFVRGFNVVAEEVRKLAESASASTKEIGGIIKDISRTVREAVTAMEEGSKEVEAGVKGTGEAGIALGEILKSVEMVHNQVNEVVSTSTRMTAASNQLTEVMETVSAVVEENTAATEDMLEKSGDVAQSIDNISAVSEENSAAVEEVSASIEEISAQIQDISDSASDLDKLAQALRQSMTNFKL